MKAEPILARVNAILALSDTSTRIELQKLADDLAGYVRQEVAASRGVGDAAKTIQRMLNGLKKSDAGRTALHYAWIDEEGRQCACDGFRAYRLNEPLPLEERPESAGKGIDLDKIIPDIAAGSFDALPLPSAADLKAHIALERAAKGRKYAPLWDFGPGRPVVAQYLLDLVTVFPDAAEIFVQRGPRGLFRALYARSERGEAVVLPVRPVNSEERQSQAEAIEQGREAAAKARKHFDALAACYASEIDSDPEYALSPDDFAELARWAYQPAA